MKLDLSRMLEKIERGQWALEDINWRAPGADAIRPEQRAKLAAFMTDLVWIEHVGARGFAALGAKAREPELQQIYRYFELEEERHARAEAKLMRRWGMLSPGQIPVANTNIRLVINWLDRYPHKIDFATLTCVIAMLEVALDGALVKFLLEEVDDPLCESVFARINQDESRHLAVDFHVMERVGEQVSEDQRRLLVFLRRSLTPAKVAGALAYIPLLNRMRDNLVTMGLDEERLYQAIRRFDEVGDRSEATGRSRAYRVIREHGRMVVQREHPYHYLADALVAITSRIPDRALGPLPAWTARLAS
ncbi:MAG: ferritin-like domain-containing protein [Polyangiaceae bacterium]